MGKFKKYIFCEQIGLGNIGNNISKYVNSQWLSDTIGGALVNSDFNNTGTKPIKDYIQGNQEDIDLTIPSVKREGRIVTLLLKKNPIYIKLSDGTEAHLTYDQWKRIEGKPAIGKVMTIIFQRNPKIQTSERSKIAKIIVRD